MSKIEELKRESPGGRAKCLQKQFRKNRQFFAKKYPEVAKLLNSGGIAPYHINVTDDFLNIVNQETGELCHPELGLDKFSEKLGEWTHNAWKDYIEGRLQSYPDHGKYSQFVGRFQQNLLGHLPALTQRMSQRIVNLPSLPNGKHFSNPVVFMGIFHGLHIDYYLDRTQINNVLFVEPEPARFILSCYFLDYEKLARRFGDLLLHIGDGFPDSAVELFFKNSKITGTVWFRVLQGYAFESEELLQKLRLKWRQFYDVWHPADWQLTGIQNAMTNIEQGAKICAKSVPLTEQCRIIVVGAGPSLSQDLDWLKENQNRFIIFSAHSAASALQKKGIRPDFVFSFDIDAWSTEIYQRLQLDHSVPIVTTINDVPGKFSSFQEVLMLVDGDGINPVDIEVRVPSIRPTTGNMALAFACWCHVKEIYLFGFDFGFKKATETHVAESSAYQSESEQRSVLHSGHLPVSPNFVGEAVVTQSYFNLARLSAQALISKQAESISVFNCSDGAKIVGAKPCRKEEIEEREYCKEVDVDRILSMFFPLQKDVHWTSYSVDGDTLLEEFKSALLNEMAMKRFSWLEFSRKIDNYRSTVAKKISKTGDPDQLDFRLLPFIQVVELLLSSWYRLLCFTNSAAEWQLIYQKGFGEFSNFIQEMEWPGETASMDNHK